MGFHFTKVKRDESVDDGVREKVVTGNQVDLQQQDLKIGRSE